MKFVPILQPRVWGGCNLAKLGKKLPPRERIGESWEICDRAPSAGSGQAEAQSVVANGPLAGKTIRRIWNSLAPNPQSPFPLLIKWLDVVQPLSVQVHPDGRSAKRLGGEPKTEAWYIVAAARNAKIWAGLRRGVTRQQLARAIIAGTAENLLCSFRPRVGEVVFMPAGCVHAARGVVALEVQQNSDTTFRLYDWGRGRQLQIEQGLACVNPRLQPKRGKSARCKFFSMRALTFTKTWKSPHGFSIVCIARGSGKILWHGGVERFGAGDTWLLPVAAQFETRNQTTAVVVQV